VNYKVRYGKVVANRGGVWTQARKNISRCIIECLSSKIIKNLVIMIPQRKSIQTNITQILIEMDIEITELEKRLINYEMLKQGTMQVLLTGKIRLI
jgi:type I restriction enzyme S subunit